MKYISLIICLGLALSAFGQRKKKSKTEKFISVQSGLLIDLHEQVDYMGLYQINLGFNSFKNNKLQSLSLDFIGYKSNYQLNFETGTNLTIWERNRKSFELEYFRSFFHKGKEMNGFFVGPTASAYFNQNTFLPYIPSQYKTQSNCFCVATGMRALYYIPITKKLQLNIATKLTIIDVGFERKRIFDPNLPIIEQSSNIFKFNLYRNQYQLLVGFNYNL